MAALIEQGLVGRRAACSVDALYRLRGGLYSPGQRRLTPGPRGDAIAAVAPAFAAASLPAANTRSLRFDWPNG